MAYEDDIALLNSSLANLNNMIQSQRDYELQSTIAEKDIELAEKQFALSEENQRFNQMIADKNFGLQVAQHDYEQRLNQIKMQREDNAIQRRVADFERAGFSPLAVIGSNGAGVGNIINPQAPQYDATGINSSVDKQINALQSKQGAFARKMQSITEKRNARLQSLAYSTEMSNMLTQIANNKAQRQLLQEQTTTQKYKNKYYEVFGYNEESPVERLFSKLINYAIDKYDDIKKEAQETNSSVTSVAENKINTYASKIGDNLRYKNLTNDSLINTFNDYLDKCTKGFTSYFDIKRLNEFAHFKFGFDTKVKLDRIKSLSSQEVEDIRNRFFNYRTEFINGYKR